MKHIILENTVCNNTGDGAIMLSAVKILRTAFGNDVHITIFDQDEKAGALYPDHVFYPLLAERLFRFRLGGTRLKRLRSRFLNFLSLSALWCGKYGLWVLVRVLVGQDIAEDIKRYVSADLILTTGGTYLVENYDLSNRITQFRIDLFLGKPLIFFTQSLGPFEKEENREALFPIFNTSPLLLLRDERSQRHLDGLLEDMSKSHVVADSVFALTDTSHLKQLLENPQNNKIRNVAVSVREWPYFKDRSPEEGMRIYKNSVAVLVQKLVEKHDINVTFLSTCQGLPDYRYDDSQVAADIIDMLPAGVSSRVTLNRDYHTPQALMEILKGMDMVVATRMHMMIMSLCVGVPVLPISYEFKTTELAHTLGLSDILSDIETITEDDCVAKADLFLKDFNTIREKTLRGVLEQHDSAMGAARLIGDCLA